MAWAGVLHCEFLICGLCGLRVDGNVNICIYDFIEVALNVAWSEPLACSSLTALNFSNS